jgi:hypothetical protein
MANSSLLGYPSALSSTAYKLGKIAMVVTHQLGKLPHRFFLSSLAGWSTPQAKRRRGAWEISSVTRLTPCQSAMAACSVFRREISRTAFWDFCNTIGGKPDGRRTRPESYLSGTADGWVAAATTLLLALGQSEVRVAQVTAIYC